MPMEAPGQEVGIGKAVFEGNFLDAQRRHGEHLPCPLQPPPDQVAPRRVSEMALELAAEGTYAETRGDRNPFPVERRVAEMTLNEIQCPEQGIGQFGLPV